MQFNLIKNCHPIKKYIIFSVATKFPSIIYFCHNLLNRLSFDQSFALDFLGLSGMAIKMKNFLCEDLNGWNLTFKHFDSLERKLGKISKVIFFLSKRHTQQVLLCTHKYKRINICIFLRIRAQISKKVYKIIKS